MIGEVRPICHISMPPAKADGVPIALIPSAQMASKMADTSVLGGFVSNHDGQFWFACMFIPLASPDRIFPGMTVPRARSRTTDDALLANMFTYSFVADGVPIWYYGDEQGGDGVEDENAPLQWRNETSDWMRRGTRDRAANRTHAAFLMAFSFLT